MVTSETFPVEPTAPPPSPTADARRLRRMVWGLGGVVILAFLLIVSLFSWRTYDQAVQEADRQALDITAVLEEQARRTFGAIDLALLQIVGTLERRVATGRGIGPEARDVLEPVAATMAEVSGLIILDQEGRILVGSDPALEAGADRSALVRFQAFADGSFHDLYIGQPRADDTGQIFLPISRRFSRPDGSLAGVVIAALSPEPLRQFYRTLDLGNHGVARLFLRDGTVIVREPYEINTVGESFAHIQLFRSWLTDADSGVHTIRFADDGIVRHSAYAVVHPYPLVASAAMARIDALSYWYDELTLLVAISAVFLPSILLLIALIQRQIGRRLAVEQALTAASEDARRTRDRLTEALESISDGFVLYGPDQRVVLANSQARKQHPHLAHLLRPGTHRREIVRVAAQRDPLVLRSSDIDAYIESELQRRSRPRPTFDTQLEDGRWIRVTDHATRDGGIVSIRQDITEARRANAELADFSDKLQTLTAAALVVTASLDAREVLDFVTDEARKIVGAHQSFAVVSPSGNWQRATVAHSLSRKYADWWGQAPPETMAETCHALCGDHRPTQLNADALAAHPVWHDRSWSGPALRGALAVPLTDRQGRRIGSILLSDRYEGDFTETDEVLLTQFARIAAMALDNARLVGELRQTEQQLRDAQRLARLGSWRLGPTNTVMDWSMEMFGIFGRDPAQGMPELDEALAYLLPEDRERTRQELFRAFEGSSRADLTFRLKRGNDGEMRDCRVEGRAVLSPGGRPIGMIGIVQDITDRKRIEEQLHQAQKMEAVGQLTGGIAHDFNNLLTVILGNAELLRDALRANPRQHAMIDIVHRAAERGAELTQRLLAFSRRQALAPATLDLGGIVADLREMMQRSLGESISIDVGVAPDLWLTQADPAQLEAALINLAINARDAMPGGGRLAIELTNVSIESITEGERHGELPPGDYVALSVSDTGSGMEPEVLKRCVEPFFTTKAVGKGSGLGLSMAYGFARQSGGTLTVYSEAGFGTTVRLYLPRACPEAKAAEAVAAARAATQGRGERVLVVEDDDFVRAYAIEQLETLGYQVAAATNGSEALAALEKAASPFQLLFTDIVMPGMDGRELARQALGRWPGLKVLYTSGYSENVVLDGDERAAMVLLQKPYRVQDLASKLRTVLET